jgi:hypothetical protein
MERKLTEIKTCDKSDKIRILTSISELREIANNDSNDQCKCAALDRLSDLNNLSAMDAIFELLMSSKDGFVREICALPAIARMDADMVLRSMEQKLAGSSEEICHQAIEVIGQFDRNNQEVIRLLRKIALEETGRVCHLLNWHSEIQQFLQAPYVIS